MGLYDGFDGKSDKGSTAEMAKWLDLPLILVIDTHAVARSAAAIVHGLRSFDSQVKIAGIILNRVAGEGHYRILSDAIIDTPILGSLPADPSIEIPERHLGLLTAKEERTVARIQAIGEFFQKHIRIDGNCAIVMGRDFSPQLFTLPQFTPSTSFATPSASRMIAAQSGAFYVLTDHSLEIWATSPLPKAPRRPPAR